MTEDPDCLRFGNHVPGGTTYDPPNPWDALLVPLRDAATSSWFGWVKPRFVVSPPPSGAAADDEIRQLLALQQNRTAADERAIREQASDFRFAFYDALGLAGRPEESFPETHLFLDSIRFVTRFWILKYKHCFNRPRPFQVSRQLEPLFCPGHPAYPSGHGGESRAIAVALWHLLAADFPVSAEAASQTATRVGRLREIGGIHYPSDTACGIDIAEQLLEVLAMDPKYRAKVAQVQGELLPLVKP